jgi:hypothetical protein
MNPITNSAPRVDAGLLLLRFGVGLSLAILFGLPKLIAATFCIHAGQPWPFIDFNRKIGLPAPVLVAYYQSLNVQTMRLFRPIPFLFTLLRTLLRSPKTQPLCFQSIPNSFHKTPGGGDTTALTDPSPVLHPVHCT